MNYKSANTQVARDAGLVAVGAMVALLGWQFVDCYAVVLSTLVGAAAYMNDRLQQNSPSINDPFCTLFGGLLIAVFMYFRYHYGH